MEPEPPKLYLYPMPTQKKPSLKIVERWLSDGVYEATDGCTVEPDGWCEHGHVSWLLYLELM